jgi:plasmid replication initiation protein
MRAGLVASTVTPGNTAPVVSRTTPAIELCADAHPGAKNNHAVATNKILAEFMGLIVTSQSLARLRLRLSRLRLARSGFYHRPATRG